MGSLQEFRQSLLEMSDSVISVVTSPYFKTELMGGSGALLSYLCQKEIVEEAWNVIFGDEGAQNRSVIESLMFVFTGEGGFALTVIQRNPVIMEKLQDWMKSPKEKLHNPRLAGYFCRIAQARYRARSRIPDLERFLLQNLCTISYEQTLIQIIQDGTESFAFSATDVHPILISENRIYGLRFLVEYLKLRNSEAIRVLDHELILSTLLSIAAESKGMEAFLAMQIVSTISEQTSHRSLIDSYEGRFPREIIRTDLRLVPLLQTYPRRLSLMIDPFLDSKLPTAVCEAVLNRISALSVSELESLVSEQNLAIRVIYAFEHRTVNGHIAQLALILNSKRIITGNQTWSRFMNEKCIPVLRKMDLLPEKDGNELFKVGEIRKASSYDARRPDPVQTAATRSCSLSDGESFNYVRVDDSVRNSNDRTNITMVPSLNIQDPLRLMMPRRSRTRNMGSVTPQDLASIPIMVLT